MSLTDVTQTIASVAGTEHRTAFGRTFFGSLLGQSLVLLGMILAYVAAIAALWQYASEPLLGLWDLVGDVAFFALIGAPLAVIAVFSLAPTALRAWRERRLSTRVIIRDAGEPEVFRLHPYGSADRARFRRPDGADDTAVAWIEGTDRSLFYLSGASGTGKSSLLAASVLPHLRDAGWAALSLRVDRDPVGQVRQALLDAPHLFAAPPDPETPLEGLLEQAEQERARVGGPPLLIVIDQFEEFLILNEPAAQAPLIDLLRRLDDRPRPKLRVLCVYRADYGALLFKLSLPRSVVGVSGFALAPFLRREAEAFLRRGGHALTEAGYAALFAGLDRVEDTPGLYRPITLNMVGLVLQRMGDRIAGDPARLIETYLRRCLTRGAARDFARPVLSHLLTRSATRLRRDVGEIVVATGFQPWQVEKTLADLEDDGLVRRPQGGDAGLWEISHDFVARQIGLLLFRLRSGWLRRTAPVALPAAAIGWAATLFLAIDYWPALRERTALAELRAMDVLLVTTNAGDGLRIDRPLQVDDVALRRIVDLAGDLRSPIVAFLVSETSPLGLAVTDLSPLAELPLTYLNLSSSYFITDLSPLADLPLTSLDLSNADGIADLSPLADLPLTDLDLSFADGITDLSPLADLPLTDLDFSYADGITDLSPLAGLPLTHLDLSNVDGITDLSPLADLPLTNLNLAGADGITDLSPLADLPLTRLSLSYADGITDLSPLAGMYPAVIRGASPELLATLPQD